MSSVLAHLQHTDPSRYGRIDEQGTVFLLREGREEEIGVWQAGTPEAGLAHYARKFDDVVTEVALLEARLATHPEDAQKIEHSLAAAGQSVPQLAALGDHAALTAAIALLIDKAQAAASVAAKDREEKKAQAAQQKTALVEEAESLAQLDDQWKATGDRLREIMAEWKTIRGAAKSADDALWKRFVRARETFHRRRGAHFAELDRTRAEAKRVKEELVAQAQKLASSTEWAETTAAFQELMTQWKQAGRAPRSEDDRLWAQFKGAQDAFFGAKRQNGAKRDEEFEANAEAKRALLAEYDGIDPAKGIEPAKRQLRELQEKWEEIGKVPRESIRELEQQLTAIEDRVRGAEESQWRRSDPQANARAAQFREKVAALEDQAAKREAAGDAKTAASLRDQAAQWGEWARAAEGAVDSL